MKLCKLWKYVTKHKTTQASRSVFRGEWETAGLKHLQVLVLLHLQELRSSGCFSVTCMCYRVYSPYLLFWPYHLDVVAVIRIDQTRQLMSRLVTFCELDPQLSAPSWQERCAVQSSAALAHLLQCPVLRGPISIPHWLWLIIRVPVTVVWAACRPPITMSWLKP